jgi:hypothetical protein
MLGNKAARAQAHTKTPANLHSRMHSRTQTRTRERTHARSEHVILIAFPGQQWLHKRALTLRYTHVAVSLNIQLAALCRTTGLSNTMCSSSAAGDIGLPFLLSPHIRSTTSLQSKQVLQVSVVVQNATRFIGIILS